MKTIRFLALCLLVLVAPGIGAQDTSSYHFDAIVRNAEQGYAEAQYELGRAYEIGYPYPVFRNDAEAAKWYRLAAEQGYAAAQYKFGSMYRIGTRSVPRNDAEGAKWYRLAAEQGYAAAQHSLGHMYFTGDGVPQDYAEGAKWYRLAAEQGYAAAQYSLGLRYATGDGVPQDYIQAHMWLHLAAASHDYPDRDRDEAAQMRDMIGSALSAEDLARAQAFARDWKQSP